MNVRSCYNHSLTIFGFGLGGGGDPSRSVAAETWGWGWVRPAAIWLQVRTVDRWPALLKPASNAA